MWCWESPMDWESGDLALCPCLATSQPEPRTSHLTSLKPHSFFLYIIEIIIILEQINCDYVGDKLVSKPSSLHPQG